MEREIEATAVELRFLTALIVKEIGIHASAAEYIQDNELVFVNHFANLEVNTGLLDSTQKKFPELGSHTVMVVGFTGSGKSSLIRGLTPAKCPKPTVAVAAQQGNMML